MDWDCVEYPSPALRHEDGEEGQCPVVQDKIVIMRWKMFCVAVSKGTAAIFVTARGDTSLLTRRLSCLQAWYGREVRYDRTLTAVLWLKLNGKH